MESTLEPTHPEDCPWHRDWHQCNCGLFNTLVYSEPGEDGSVLIRRVSAEMAIKIQIDHAKFMNQTYSSQDEALQDFMANNWATFEVI